jgi:E3 ubiquitin-protein ligase RGLG
MKHCFSQFDNELPQRKFDNFQFVNFHHVMSYSQTDQMKEVNFALEALQEIPDQYQTIKQLGLLGYE